MKNDRLCFLGLVHIHRDFEVDLYKAMEVFVFVKTRRADFEQFLSIKVIKIVLDSIYVIWNPKMAPDRTILHLVEKMIKSQTPSPSQELWRAHY